MIIIMTHKWGAAPISYVGDCSMDPQGRRMDFQPCGHHVFPCMADGAGAGAAKRKADEGAVELRVRTMYESAWAKILAFDTFGIRWFDRSAAAKEDFFR